MHSELESALALVQAELISYPAARARAGLTTTGFDIAIEQGRAPRPIRIAGHVARFFLRHEFEAWLATYHKGRRTRLRPPSASASAEPNP